MTTDILVDALRRRLSHRRFQHSLGVSRIAEGMAPRLGIDPAKAAQAGLLHDYARDIPLPEMLELARQYGLPERPGLMTRELLHAQVGASLIRRELGIDDKEILRAVELHTTGDEDMSPLDRIVCLADYAEPGRDFPGVEEIRRLAGQDIDRALLRALDGTLSYLINRRALIDPRTVRARNWLLLRATT